MVFIAIMALLFAQALPLHAHNPHDRHNPPDRLGMPDKHEHHAATHIADVNDEAHGPATEIDLSTHAIIKNLKSSDTLIAVLTFIAILFVPLLINGNRWSIRPAAPLAAGGMAFRPPLRAPPL